MTSHCVTGFGETVLDIVLGSQSIQKALAGGSILNTLVSLSRAGFSCRLISETGNDAAGELIHQFLLKEKVNSAFVYQNPDTQTTLALAVLNPSGDAAYSFYKNTPKERFTNLKISFQAHDIFIFGSSLALDAAARPTLQMLISAVQKANGLVFYDPNIRKPITENDPTLALIRYNFGQADVVRGSHEDFLSIFNTQNVKEIFQLMQPSNCKLLIMTSAEGKIHLCTPYHYATVEVSKVEVVNTIGAGDAFNAGVLNYLIINDIGVKELDSITKNQLVEVGENGRKYAAMVCASDENYIPKKGKTMQ